MGAKQLKKVDPAKLITISEYARQNSLTKQLVSYRIDKGLIQSIDVEGGLRLIVIQ